MLGTSALIVSVAFLIRSISPAYATNTLPVNVANTNGIVEGGNVYFISNGYMYKVKLGQLDRAFQNNFRYEGEWGQSKGGFPVGSGDNFFNDGLPVWWDYNKIE
jgi:hypothetical protein